MLMGNLLIPIILFIVAFLLLLHLSLSFEVFPDKDPDIFDQLFHSPETFKKDYMQMETNFKIFVYRDGDPNGGCNKSSLSSTKGKFGNEGLFYKNILDSQFLTTDPDKAHLFFIPISCIGTFESAHDFIQNLIFKYPYWNRTLGADHFIVACRARHVHATQLVSALVKNSIRVFCSSSYGTEYIPHKDFSLPQIPLQFSYMPAGNDVKKRTLLAYMQRGDHVWQNDAEPDIKDNSYDDVNELLIHHQNRIWYHRIQCHLIDIKNITQKYQRLCSSTDKALLEKNQISIKKETSPHIPLVRKISKHFSFQETMYKSKFCICFIFDPTADTCIAKAIHYGCVPVIFFDHFDLPFNDILDWRKFSVILKESDFYNLENILKGISDEEYRALQSNTVKVQKHFHWNSPPDRFDIFNMLMYELWLRRHVIRY